MSTHVMSTHAKTPCPRAFHLTMLFTTLLTVLAGTAFTSALTSSQALAETITAERIASTRRLLPLTKLTVGPDDQYDSAVSPDGRLLVFTHKADLASNLQAQDLQSGEVKDLLPPNADSQEPAFGLNDQLAFTYFKFDARGDICFTTLSGTSPGLPLKTLDTNSIRCLNRAASATVAAGATAQRNGFGRSNPFWASATELGFLERDISRQTSRIVIENINTGQQTIVAEGRLESPTMKPGGKYLAYSEQSDTDRRLVLVELSPSPVGSKPQVRSRQIVRVDLPGISGFPAISNDERYLYFSHYLNDTNDDRSIDGNDNAVVFRAPIAQLLSSQTRLAHPDRPILPEQLTSVETSCSFPKPAQDSVFLTCAFEGSLDIYRIPSTGIVPSDWDEARLENALQTSRTYQDRILLLNTLKRLQQKNPSLEKTRVLDDRLLVNHLYADDTVAASWYLQKLEQTPETATPTRKDPSFHSLLRLYLEGRGLKKAQPSETISREFQERILALDRKAARIEGEPRFRAIVRGLLHGFIHQEHESESFVQQIKKAQQSKQTKFNNKERPLERYFQFELERDIHQRGLPASLPRLIEAYRRMIAAPGLPDESRIYYAVALLEQLQTQEREQNQKLERTKQIAILEKASQGLPPSATALLKSEAVVLRLIDASDDKAKLGVYRELDALMSQTRGDYFLRKALYVRAIVNFARATEFKYLSLVATNWLKYTNQEDTEFAYAREVFSTASLDQAYSHLGKGNLALAGNFFYESLSFTDDLESHIGYLRAMTQRGQRSAINERYKNLHQRRFVDDNMKFVEAMLILIDAESTATGNRSADTSSLDAAIEKLEAMSQDRDSAVRHLVLGFCYMDKLLRTSTALDFDAELFQKSHRSLMLAFDLGRDNVRVKASALMNLGILHQRVQNHGLAARFFSLRKSLGFTSEEERARFEALYARSLGHSRHSDQAAAEIASLPKPLLTAPLLERQAFHSMNAGKYQDAARLYGELLSKVNSKVSQEVRVMGDANLARIHLSYGYSLLKLKRPDEAKAALQQALVHVSGLKREPRGTSRATEFDPRRLQIIAYGFLSQVGSSAERAAALEKRLALLDDASDLIDDANAARIQALTRFAELVTPMDPVRAAHAMNEVSRLVGEYGEANGYVGATVFKALTNTLAHAILHPAAYSQSQSQMQSQAPSQAETKRLRSVVEACVRAYDAQKIAQPMLDYQKLKLRILWAGYATKVLGQPESVPRDLESILASGTSQSLKETLPEQWKELQSLSAALRRRD